MAVRALVAAAALALLLALSGCGGDDEEAATAPTATAPTETSEPAPTESEPAETETETGPAETETETEDEDEPGDSPEDEPGGAGDEEPARALAIFTGRDGRITPRVVRVPAFISIRVELRSTDGREYGLRFGPVEIVAGGRLGSLSTTFDGLRPGEALVGRPTGRGNRVRVEATAEPGP